MRSIVFGMFLWVVAIPAAAQSQPPALPATDVTAAQLKAFIDKMPKDAITDSAIRVVDVGGSRIGIYGVFRPKSLPGDAIAHETKTVEVYYMLQGAGTLVTGGTIKNPKGRDDGRSSNGPRGERIDGGVSRRITPGDIIVIPGRTPHWWSELDSDIRYLIVRADPAGTMPLK